MTFAPHVRLTFGGTLGPLEQWSCSLSLVPQGDQWQTYAVVMTSGVAFDTQSYQDYLMANYLDDVQWDDIVQDVEDYFSNPALKISAIARLRWVKMVAIDANGKYGGAPREAAMNIQGPDQGSALPHQISRKVTLLSHGDLDRVKGGFYLPAPSGTDLDGSNNLFPLEETQGVQAATLTFLENLNNAPGFDAEGYKVVIASQGRHNANGSVRRPPTNHEVYGVSVGRRPDVQRRRANREPELRPAPSVL